MSSEYTFFYLKSVPFDTLGCQILLLVEIVPSALKYGSDAIHPSYDSPCIQVSHAPRSHELDLV